MAVRRVGLALIDRRGFHRVLRGSVGGGLMPEQVGLARGLTHWFALKVRWQVGSRVWIVVDGIVVDRF